MKTGLLFFVIVAYVNCLTTAFFSEPCFIFMVIIKNKMCSNIKKNRDLVLGQ